MKKLPFFILISIVFISCNDDKSNYAELPDAKIQIGKAIFFDKNLSNPMGQACASCHAPEKGFSDPNNNAISSGAIPTAFGSRNTPALSYTVFAPERYYNNLDETYIGGLFLDGKAANLKEQFIHPMLNPVEMNNASVTQIAQKIRNADYYAKIISLYGNDTSDSELMTYIGDALAKFQKSSEVNSFTSKFDYASKGLVTYTDDEKKGLNLFKGKAKCANCHVQDSDPNTGKVLFTDFSYDNIGVPKNNNNPFYSQPVNVNPSGNNYIDLGIGAVVGQTQHNGKFKVPTLRNIAISAPYFHNGSMATLKEVIHFYNVRDLNTGEFAPPEYNQNVNTEELGNLKLSSVEELQLEKFLNTLTDHYKN
jgi:cytochrome c peroxidase